MQTQFDPDVRFHNVYHSLDMVHALMLFLYNYPDKFDMLCVKPMDLFGLLLSTALLHQNHTGLTDDFLVN